MKQNENTKYVKLGITGASVLAFGFAIMYILNQSQNIAAGIRGIFNISFTRSGADDLGACRDVWNGNEVITGIVSI